MQRQHLAVFKHARTNPVQTPSNISQSQLTDPEEIYDSVRSLSQAALDDSLHYKKVHARLVVEQAVREMEEDELVADSGNGIAHANSIIYNSSEINIIQNETGSEDRDYKSQDSDHNNDDDEEEEEEDEPEHISALQ